MEQRLSLVTLGVADLERARAFYRALGWTDDASRAPTSSSSRPAAWWWRCGTAPSWPRTAAYHDGGGWGGVTLAHNVRSPGRGRRGDRQATAAGATIPRAGAETFWGGYSGVFIDPDGHPWEVAHNPHWTINPDGSITR